MKAIVSVFAKDSKGITAYVTSLLAQNEINILDISYLDIQCVIWIGVCLLHTHYSIKRIITSTCSLCRYRILYLIGILRPTAFSASGIGCTTIILHSVIYRCGFFSYCHFNCI